MFANHPGIAKRWFREYGHAGSGNVKAGRKQPANPQSESQEDWRKGVQRGPRLPGVKRDFKITPSPSARLTPRNAAKPTITEADKEGGVTFQHGARPGKMGKAQQHSSNPLHRRDAMVSTRKKV